MTSLAVDKEAMYIHDRMEAKQQGGNTSARPLTGFASLCDVRSICDSESECANFRACHLRDVYGKPIDRTTGDNIGVWAFVYGMQVSVLWCCCAST